MERRSVGSTDLSVSILGFGCAPVGSRAGFAESKRALLLARENGITYFDTADMYGVGGSERTLNRVVGAERDRIIISTKCGFTFSGRLKAVAWVKPLLRPLVRRIKSIKASAAAVMSSQQSQNFEPAYIEQSVHGSLTRLGTDRLDLLFLHEPPALVVRRGDVFEKLAELKRAGKIREYGVSCDPEVAIASLENPQSGITAIQVNANLLEPSALTAVLPTARSRGIGFIARQPFAHGLLLTDPRLRSLLEKSGLPTDGPSVSSLALRYLRAFDGICAILPSMMRPEHLKTNVAGMSGAALSEKERAVIAAFGAPLPQEARP